MSLESTNLSRRKLLKAGAIGVPAAGLAAFGSTLVTATSANAISADGWWGEETSAGLQRFMNAMFPQANLVVDGVISSQISKYAYKCPGLVGGWEWVPREEAQGSPTISWMTKWLVPAKRDEGPSGRPAIFASFQIWWLGKHYGISEGGVLPGPSQIIQGLQNEINQYVG